MNIFMITKPVSPLWDEGSKNLAFGLCNQISDHKFHLMTCKDTKLPYKENITYHYFYPKNALNIPKISMFDKIRLFYKIFNQKDIDVYHFIFTPRIFSSLTASMFLRFSNKKSIQTVSTTLTDSKLKKCLFADKIVVLSEWTKNRILKLGFTNVTKINPGIDLNKFSKKKISTVREKLKLSKDDFVILFPSEYSIDRGTRITLEMFRDLVKVFSKTKLIFACRIRGKKDVKEKIFLMEIVEKLGLKDKVLFLERVKFMPELINSSDLIVFPIASQDLKMEIPMVLLESLALEKPIIISDIPPFNEITRKRNIGFKVRPGNIKELLKSVTSLIRNKKLKNNLGKEGRILIEKEFNIKNVAQEYKKLYEMLR